MAIGQAIQLNSSILPASNLNKLVGVRILARLTGANEIPAVSDLTLCPTRISLSIRANTKESSCSVSLIRTSSAITSDILDRPNGEIIIDIYGKLLNSTEALLKTYNFNYQDIDEDYGASSGTVILSGTKIISDLGQSVQRPLAVYSSKSFKPVNGVNRYTYNVNYLDIFAFRGGDYIHDGAVTTQVDSIKATFDVNGCSASIESE